MRRRRLAVIYLGYSRRPRTHSINGSSSASRSIPMRQSYGTSLRERGLWLHETPGRPLASLLHISRMNWSAALNGLFDGVNSQRGSRLLVPTTRRFVCRGARGHVGFGSAEFPGTARRTAHDPPGAKAGSPAGYCGNYCVTADHALGIDRFILEGTGEDTLLFSDYQSGIVRRLFRAISPLAGGSRTAIPWTNGLASGEQS